MAGRSHWNVGTRGADNSQLYINTRRSPELAWTSQGEQINTRCVPSRVSFPKNIDTLRGEIKLVRKRVVSGQHTRSILPPPVPWKDTKASQVLCPDSDISIAMSNLSFHQAESFIAQNSKDQVRLHDFVIFCRRTPSDLESQPPVSNIYILENRRHIDPGICLDQLGIGRVMEIVLMTVEDSNRTSRHTGTPRNLGASHVTLEVYNFDEERHKIWEVPCIRPSEPESFVVVAAKVSHPLLHLMC